jgi:hypothetical protein
MTDGKDVSMEKWLKCKISLGQFTGEFAVNGLMSNANEFSLFSPKEYLKFKEAPVEGKSVEGSIRVTKLQEKDDLVLVVLPQPALENGRTITVKASQVK